MDATSLGLPKPELTDGGTTTTERQAYKDAWDAQVETADANILSAIGTGGGQVDTAANFTATNPTLNENQFGYESDTGKFKLGDGATAWNSLAYYFDGTSGSGDVTGGSASTDGEVVVYDGGTGKAIKRSNALTGIATVTAGVLGVCSNLTDIAYIPASQKNAANGVAPLDADSKVPTENLPAGLPSEADWPAVTNKPDKYIGSGLDYADLSAAIAAAPQAIVHMTASESLAADKTIPAGMVLNIHQNAKLTVTGYTLLFAPNSNLIDPGPRQIFVDAGTDLTEGVKFGGSTVGFVRPEWWGFKTSAFDDTTQATANTKALNQALSATSRASDQFIIPVLMAAGTTYIQGDLAPGHGGAAILRGAGAGDINNPGSGLFHVHNPSNPIAIDTGFVEISGIYLALYEGQTKGIYVNNRGTRIRDMYVEGSYNSNTDYSDGGSALIYLDSGSNQSKVRDLHILGHGTGIFDVCDGGLISNCDLEGNTYKCTGIVADGSFIQGCQIQYYKFGIKATVNPSVMISAVNFQQNFIGLYAPYLSYFNVSNSRFGGNQYGLHWKGGYVNGFSPSTLSNCKFVTNTKAAIAFQGSCHGTLSDIDIDIYVNDANFHNRFVGLYPAYLDTMLGYVAMKFPIFKNIRILSNSEVVNPVINLYNLTGLNGTFAAPYETGLTVTATAGEGQVTLVRSSGSWAAAGLRVDDWATIDGFDDPVLNGQFKIISIGSPNAQTMVVNNWQPVSEGPTTDISYSANPSLYVPSGVDFTTTVTEGDHVKMTGNFSYGGATNNGWMLTVWQVQANTLRFMSPMESNAKSSLAYQCPESASSINIRRVPHLFSDSFTIRAGSAISQSRFYGIGEGAKIIITLDGANVTLDKWGNPDMVATKAGATYTDVTDSASFTLFPSSPSVDDAVYVGGDLLPSGVKFSLNAAYGGTPPTFDWEYYNGSTWAAMPSHTVPNFAATGEFITYFSMPVNAIPTRFYDVGSDIPGSTNKRKYLYWVRCRITAGGTPTGSVTCDAAIKACWLRISTDTFPTSPIEIGEMATLTLENSSGVIKEISRSEP